MDFSWCQGRMQGRYQFTVSVKPERHYLEEVISKCSTSEILGTLGITATILQFTSAFSFHSEMAKFFLAYQSPESAM